MRGERSIFCGKMGKKRGMIRQSRNLAAVKRAIETCLRSKVDVTVNLGRNKVLSYRGELSGVYPALFTVRPDDERFLGKTSYSYAEVLCGSVKVKRAESPRGGAETAPDRFALPAHR